MSVESSKDEFKIEFKSDHYAIVSSVINDIHYCGILLKCPEKASDLPYTYSTTNNNAGEEPPKECPQLKKLVGLNPSTNRQNGLLRVDQDGISSVCFRRTYFNENTSSSNASASEDYNPYRLLQNERAAKGIKRLECRPSVRLRPLATQRGTTLCARCQEPFSTNGVGTVTNLSKRARYSPVESSSMRQTRPSNNKNAKSRIVSDTKNLNAKRQAPKIRLHFRFSTTSQPVSVEKSPLKSPPGETVKNIVQNLFNKKGSEIPSAVDDPIFKPVEQKLESSPLKFPLIHPVSPTDKDSESNEVDDASAYKRPKIPKLKIRFGSPGKRQATVISCQPVCTDHDKSLSVKGDEIATEFHDTLDVSPSVSDAVSPVASTSTSISAGHLPNFVQLGAIVWAKMRGYPCWPASVYSIYQNSACVVWCGSMQHNFVPIAVLEPFLDKFSRRYQPRRNSSYQKAVADALLRCGQPETPVAELLAPSCRKMLEQMRRSRHFGDRQKRAGRKGSLMLDPAATLGLGSPPVASELNSSFESPSSDTNEELIPPIGYFASPETSRNTKKLLKQPKNMEKSSRKKSNSGVEAKNTRKSPRRLVIPELEHQIKIEPDAEDQNNTVENETVEKSESVVKSPDSNPKPILKIVPEAKPNSAPVLKRRLLDYAMNNEPTAGSPDSNVVLSPSSHHKALPEDKLAEIKNQIIFGRREKAADHQKSRLSKYLIPTTKQQAVSVLLASPGDKLLPTSTVAKQQVSCSNPTLAPSTNQVPASTVSYSNPTTSTVTVVKSDKPVPVTVSNQQDQYSKLTLGPSVDRLPHSTLSYSNPTTLTATVVKCDKPFGATVTKQQVSYNNPTLAPSVDRLPPSTVPPAYSNPATPKVTVVKLESPSVDLKPNTVVDIVPPIKKRRLILTDMFEKCPAVDSPSKVTVAAATHKPLILKRKIHHPPPSSHAASHASTSKIDDGVKIEDKFKTTAFDSPEDGAPEKQKPSSPAAAVAFSFAQPVFRIPLPEPLLEEPASPAESKPPPTPPLPSVAPVAPRSPCDSPKLVIDESDDSSPARHQSECQPTSDSDCQTGIEKVTACPASPVKHAKLAPVTTLHRQAEEELDEFDDVLTELRRMNEMCENSSSSCSTISR